MKTNLLEQYKKAKTFENPVTQIAILEDFKTLTDSSSMPLEIKDRFKAVADKDILQLTASLTDESNK